jgi:hypothetical protein
LQTSAVETLILSGSIDFSTPAEFTTNELLPFLSNGTQVILSEMGHVGDVFKLQPKTTERLLISFYDTGVVDKSLVTYIPMNFHVNWGWPKLAKIIFVVLVFVLVIMIFGILKLLIYFFKKYWIYKDISNNQI